MPEVNPPANPEISVLAALKRMEARAQAGDTEALDRIRAFLDVHPEIWTELGDLSKVVQRGWLEQMAANSPLALESMLRTLGEMRRDLLGESTDRLERLLVDDIIATWLEMKYGESLLTQTVTSLPVSAHHLKRMDSAHDRYHQAVKMLQEVRAHLPKQQAAAQPKKQAATAPKPAVKAPIAKKGTPRPAAPTSPAKKSAAPNSTVPPLKIYRPDRKSA